MQLHARQAGASSGDVLPRTGACCADCAKPLPTNVFCLAIALNLVGRPPKAESHFACGRVHPEIAFIDVK